MTEDIKPRLVEGEPVCSEKCPSYTWDSGGICSVCLAQNKRWHNVDGPCIPGLRLQRDEARAERDELKVIENLYHECRTVLERSCHVSHDETIPDIARRVVADRDQWKERAEKAEKELQAMYAGRECPSCGPT